MRRSRWEWLSARFPPIFHPRPAKAKRPAREKKDPAVWSIKVPGWEKFKVRARTRSEARGEGKKLLGLETRLPVGTTMELLG